MNKYIDLHTHTVNSDGSMTATELVEHAKAAGLAAIALTDHDTTGGIREAAARADEIGLEFVPGIELSAQSDTETHILGYYIDIENRHLKDELQKSLAARKERADETCISLQKLGFDITNDEVCALAPCGIVGRAHHARLMMEKGYTSSVKEAFDLYLAYGRPAYCEKQYHTARQCVEIIKKSGGRAFLAHLHLTKKPDDMLFEFLKELKGYGLDGLEGYYTEYTPEMQAKYQDMAKRLDLKISGGTDFHAQMKPHIAIGTGFGNLKIPYSVLEQIRS